MDIKGLKKLYTYFALGFTIRSDFPVRELSTRGDGHSFGALEIIREDLGPSVKARFPEDSWIALEDGLAVIRVLNAGWISVANGQRVSIDAKSDADLEMVSLFLAATALPIAAMQMGRVPLHVSAVRFNEDVHLFAGESGAGKSTIVAALRSRGYEILTDDITVYDPGQTGVGGRLHFGVDRIKLWNDSVQMLGSSDVAIRQDYFRTQKSHFSILSQPSVAVDQIASITRLSWGEAQALRPLPAYKKFELLMNAVYPRKLVRHMLTLAQLKSRILQLSPFGRGLELSRSKNADIRSVLEMLLAEKSI